MQKWMRRTVELIQKKSGKGYSISMEAGNGGPNQGGPASGSGDGGTIAVRMMRRNDEEEEDEWGFVEDDRQIAQGSVAAKMMAKAKSSAGPMLRAPRTEGELPEDLHEHRGREGGPPVDLHGHRQGEGGLPADRREHHGREGELPADRRGHRGRGGELPVVQEPQGVRGPQGGRNRDWLGGIFPIDDSEGEIEERFVGPFHVGGGRGPVLLVQQLSTSSGVPSFSSGSGKPTPTFGSSISGSRQASSGGSDQRQQSTKDTMTSTIMEGQRSQQRSIEADEGGEGDDEATLEKPYVKVTTVVEIGGDKLVVEKGYKKTVQSSVLETEK